jgi:SAM-dependent methyltransferase
VAPPTFEPRWLASAALDHNHPAAEERYEALAELLNGFTMQRIYDLHAVNRVGPFEGMRMLDVGAGFGHLARQLADLVGDEGLVVALDHDPRVRDHPRIQVLPHDLRINEPIPCGPYDFIHERHRLGQLPQREEILDRLVDALRPGGTILIEAWTPVANDVVEQAPTAAAMNLYARYAAYVAIIESDVGGDHTWARRSGRALTARDLSDVDVVVHGQFWRGGQPGLRAAAAALPQLAPELLAAGMTAQEREQLLDLLRNPGLVVHPHLLYSAVGTRPLGG